MNLHTLSPALGSLKKEKRIGRGGCRGGTSGRGHNGAKSRSGYSQKRGFEGGQMPLQRRVPKFGFTPLNKLVYKPFNFYTLSSLVDEKKLSIIDQDLLVTNGLIKKGQKYKILGTGDFDKPLTIVAHAFSASAIKKIQDCGGVYKIIS